MTVQKSIIAVIFGLIATVFVCFVVFANIISSEAGEGKVNKGVAGFGQDLSGLDRQQVVDVLNAVEADLKDDTVYLRRDDRSWPVTLGELGFDLDAERMADKAIEAGRGRMLLGDWLARRKLEQHGYAVPLIADFDRGRLEFATGQLLGDIIRAPQDAGFRIGELDKVEIIPGKDGVEIDLDGLKQELLRVVNGEGKGEAEIRLVTTTPQHTTDEVTAMGITGKIAEYTTYFDPKKIDRTYNVTVAAAAFNNILVAPEEVVSFNEVVGPRSLETGFRYAPIIIDNEFQDGMGGGICQVSSTLYNAVLLANMDIVERSHHSLPVTYVPVGRDATVVYDHLDFRFKNNSEHYVYIRSEAGKAHLTFKVFGYAHPDRRVEIKSWVLATYEPKVHREEDPDLEVGKEVVKRAGLKGYKVAAERWVWDDGELRKEKLPPSDYRPLDKIIAVGTKEQPVTITPPGDVPVTDPTLPLPPEEPEPEEAEETPGGPEDADPPEPPAAPE